MHRHLLVPRRAALFVSLVAAGCQCADDAVLNQSCSPTEPCPTGYACSASKCMPLTQLSTPADSGMPDAGNATPFDAGTAMATGLIIAPATVTLTSINGSQPTAQFSAKVTLDDGTSRDVDAVYTADAPTVGSIDPAAGLYRASGEVGGAVKVKASFSYGGRLLEAAAQLTVALDWTTYSPGFSASDVMRFTGQPLTDPARAADVVYPPDRVVFPQNVAPADLQWLNGAIGDLFRVVLKKTDVTVTAYMIEDGDHHWLVDGASWRALAQTDPTETATLDLTRFEVASAQLLTSPTVHLKFARAALVGSVYYWDIAAGRIVRIDDGTITRTNFLPNPPVATDGARCVGCHVVGKSGRFMSGRLGGNDNIGAVFDLTVDLTPDPAPTVWPTSVMPASARWWFSSFNPDESRLVVTVDELGNAGMGFVDPKTGAAVPVSGIPPGKATHVAWSPDGSRIAYVENFGTWGGDFTAGDISTVPITGPDALGPPTLVHAGTSLAGGSADSYPTWSPDSKKLAFAHGTGCRSETHAAALYLMSPDGTGVVRLSNASGGPTGASSFQPRFSPFEADGYYWLTFLSRRDYGNDRVGTRGTDLQQVWVAAVKVNPQPGDDPSEVAYWLPGQSTHSRNIAAYWAPRACRPQGDQCGVASECCSGECSNGHCASPPPERCRLEGETCGGTGDCCSGRGLVCKLNACVVDIE